MDEDFKIEYKRILLGVLKAFDTFCSANGLDYYAAGGTAIGAVRHKGMIPWDDDIDVYMLRKDYDRFVGLRSQLPDPYRLMAFGDKNCIYTGAKMYDSSTELIEKEAYRRCRLGIFVDIFPLDEVCGTLDSIKKKKLEFEEKHKDFLRYFSCFSINNARLWWKNGMYRTLFLSILPRFLKYNLFRDFIDYSGKWAAEKGDMLNFHACTYPIEKEIYPKEWFSSWHYVPFEDTSIRVSSQNHEYLTQLFGDYMTPPPVEKQLPPHDLYYVNLHKAVRP